MKSGQFYSNVIPGAFIKYSYDMPVKGSRERGVPMEPDEPGEIYDIEVILYNEETGGDDVNIVNFLSENTYNNIYNECEKDISEGK